jgi:glycosyltransferase involved in cell wall biosynthesis
MSSSLVSIIIPNYNRSDVIAQTLDSLLRQTYSNWEAIVVDDGSTDNSWEIIQLYTNKDIRIKGLKRDRLPNGPSTCRNIGAKVAKGKYLIFLDSDDILAGFCLKQRIEFMENNQPLGFTIFNIIEFYKNPGDIEKIFNVHCNDLSGYLHLFLNNTIPWQTSCPIWEKDFFMKLGGFDEKMIFMEDPEFHTRALLTDNVKFEVLSDSIPDVYYRKSLSERFKDKRFIKLSIEGRILYLQKTYQHIINYSNSDKVKSKLISELRQTLINLLIRFLYPNIANYRTVFWDITYWAKQNALLTKLDYILIRVLGYFWMHNNKLVRLFRIKGLIKKIIDPDF